MFSIGIATTRTPRVQTLHMTGRPAAVCTHRHHSHMQCCQRYGLPIMLDRRARARPARPMSVSTLPIWPPVCVSTHLGARGPTQNFGSLPMACGYIRDRCPRASLATPGSKSSDCESCTRRTIPSRGITTRPDPEYGSTRERLLALQTSSAMVTGFRSRLPEIFWPTQVRWPPMASSTNRDYLHRSMHVSIVATHRSIHSSATGLMGTCLRSSTSVPRPCSDVQDLEVAPAPACCALAGELADLAGATTS
jgi:hypothetical protein